jgi:hypothetical protein
VVFWALGQRINLKSDHQWNRDRYAAAISFSGSGSPQDTEGSTQTLGVQDVPEAR